VKPLKQNKAQRAAENRMQGYRYKPVTPVDVREMYEKDINTMVGSIEKAIRWGSDLRELRNTYNQHYKNGYEVFDQAMKIISSPLYQALHEGENEGFTTTTINGVVTVNYIDTINKIVYVK
jgi:hypothetical protein